MENLSHPLIVAFIVIWLIELYFYGMQRATQLIAKRNNVDGKGLADLFLPKWYYLAWLFRIAKYGLLVAIFFAINWKWAVGLLIGGYILAIIIPIPYKALYKKIFRKSMDKMNRMELDREVIQFYAKMIE